MTVVVFVLTLIAIMNNSDRTNQIHIMNYMHLNCYQIINRIKKFNGTKYYAYFFKVL